MVVLGGGAVSNERGNPVVEQVTLKGLGLKKGPAANNPNRAKRQARQRILN